MLSNESVKEELDRQMSECPPIGPYPVTVKQERAYTVTATRPGQRFYFTSNQSNFGYIPRDIYTAEQKEILGWEFIVHKRLTRFPLNRSKLPKVSIGDEIIRERGK